MLTLILMVILFAILFEFGIGFLILPFSLIGMLFRPFGMWHRRPPMGPGPMGPGFGRGPMDGGFGHGPMGPRW